MLIARKRTICTLLFLAIQVIFVMKLFAGNLPSGVPSSGKPIITYTYASSGKVYAYTNSALTTKTGGYISCATDQCKIIAISGQAVKVTYPVSNGTKTAWFSRKAFTAFDFSQDSSTPFKANKQITTYRWKENNTTFGYISKNDSCYLLRGGASAEWLQIVYPVSGGYKMGWAKGTDLFAGSLKLDTKDFSLRKGNSKTVQAVVTFPTTLDSITWTSSDKSVVTATSNGTSCTVKAVGYGTATITAATKKGYKESVKITVPLIPTSITLNRTSGTIWEEQSIKLTAALSPVETASTGVAWSSSNAMIASVDTNGNVTGKSGGTAVITAASKADSSIKTTCSITVSSTVKVSLPSTRTIEDGNYQINKLGTDLCLSIKDRSDEETAHICITNGDAEDLYTVFSVKYVGAGCYEITNNGSGKAMEVTGGGSAAGTLLQQADLQGTDAQHWYIAQNEGGGFYLIPKCAVKRTADIVGNSEEEGTEVQLYYIHTGTGQRFDFTQIGDPTPDQEFVLKPEELFLSPEGQERLNVLDKNTEEPYEGQLLWESNDTDTATVDDNGTVTAVSEGMAIISVSSEDAEISLECIVWVEESIPEPIVLKLNPEELSLTVGETGLLSVQTVPPGGEVGDLHWESENPEIADVNVDGTVEALSPGTTVIYAYSDHCTEPARCLAIISEPIEIEVSISLNEQELLLGKKETAQLEVLVEPEGADAGDLHWESVDPSVASVDQEGKVTALSAGTTLIEVTAEHAKDPAICEVTVEEDESERIISVVLLKDHIILSPGDSEGIAVQITPDSFGNDDLIWTSRNEDVAIVDEAGIITAVGEGKTVIEISTGDGSIKEFCFVTVEKTEETRIVLDQEEIELEMDDSIQLTASVSPEGKTVGTIYWESSANSIAKVDEKGNVTAVSEGRTTIRAYTKDNSAKEAECSVLVENTPDDDKVEIILDEDELVLRVQDTAILNAQTDPADYDQSLLLWESNNTSVATVSQNGTVTAVAPGEATITISGDDNVIPAECLVTVEDEPNPDEPRLVFDQESLDLTVGAKTELHARIEPEGYEPDDLFWKSYDPDIASVDNNGVITLKAVGFTQVKAWDPATQLNAVCDVTVDLPPIDSITLEPTDLELQAGTNRSLNVKIEPDGIDASLLSWESIRPSVAQVSDEGIITAIEPGTTAIIASAADGTPVKGSCIVTVIDRIDPIFLLEPDDEVLDVGDTLAMNVVMEPKDLYTGPLIWESEKPGVATVDRYGVVTAVAEGVTVIWVYSGDDQFKAGSRVTVNGPVPPPGPDAIELDRYDLMLNPGGQNQLKATVIPQGSYNGPVYWKSDDSSVAEVSSTGVVRAVSLGETAVKAYTDDGLESLDCMVTVVEPETETETDPPPIRDGIYEVKKFTVQVKNCQGVIIKLSKKKKMAKKLEIPGSLNIEGYNVPVVGVAKNACRKMKNLTNLVIGKNVERIGPRAFSECPKLKKITIKTRKLSRKTVGAGAFSGSSANVVVKVPKGMKKKYEKFMYSKGIKRSGKVK